MNKSKQMKKRKPLHYCTYCMKQVREYLWHKELMSILRPFEDLEA